MSREYRSPLRERRAAETRRTVIEAAAQCFSELGWSGTTMAAVARRADVSVETVHATGTKGALLLEAYRTRYVGRGGWHKVTDDPETAAVLRIADPDEALATTVSWIATAHAASADLWFAIRATALVEPRVAAEFDELVRAKAETWEATARWLLRTGVIDTEVAPEQMHRFVAHLNLVLSAETYVQMVRDYGLSDTDYREWLRTTVPLVRP